MPKVKTKKSLLKRFKITGTGKLMHMHQYSRHRRAHKSNRQIRSYGIPQKLSDKQAKIIKAYI